MGGYLNFGRFGGGAYETTAVHFTRIANSGAYFESSQGLWTGNYAQATFVMCIYPLDGISLANGNGLIYTASNTNIAMGYYANSAEGWTVNTKNTSNVTRVAQDEAGVVIPLNQWSGVAWCFNGSTAKIVVNGSALTLDTQSQSGQTMRPQNDFGNVYFGRQSASTLRSYVCHIWGRPVFHDMALSANWEKFFAGPTSAVPIDLGADGSEPFGVQPTTFAPDGRLDNNLGSLNNWTQSGGTVATAPISPTD